MQVSEEERKTLIIVEVEDDEEGWGVGCRAWKEGLGVGQLKAPWVVDLFRAVQQCPGSQKRGRTRSCFEPSFHLHCFGRCNRSPLPTPERSRILA